MGLPPEDVDWTRINIVVHFGGAYPTNSPPYTNITYDPSTGLANTQKGVEYEYGNDRDQTVAMTEAHPRLVQTGDIGRLI
jgi:hypothetical protein